MNLHLTYRQLALRLSHAGFPVLRVDYPGTGDSSGSPRDPERLEAWLDALDVASSALLERSAVAHLALFGARLGGTLAARLASERNEVQDLILWGPYLGGRAFVRNERALDRLSSANEAGRLPTHAQTGDQEYLGFVYTAQTADALRALEISGLRPGTCSRALLFAWDEHSRESELAATYTEAGLEVDLVRDLRIESEKSLVSQEVPAPLLEETTRWLAQHYPRPSSDEPPQASPCAWPRAATVERSAGDGSALQEEAVFFGREADLFGLLTRPAPMPDTASRPALILVNGGNNHRAGINRNYTEWARAAAAAGSPALRIDVRGLGDSPPLEAANLNMLYRTATISDVVAALDFMTATFPERPVVLAGLCAGAFQSFHASLRDPRVHGLLLFDLLRWDLEAPRGRQRGFLHRRKRQFEQAWQRVRNALSSAVSDGVKPHSNLLADGVLELVSRGTSVSCVTALSGQGHAQLVDSLAPRLPEIEATGRFHLAALADTNHIFSPLWSQEWLERFLLDTLSQIPTTKPDSSIDA
jgi:pimeloyl-ACP methyl ester carboxylesterase